MMMASSSQTEGWTLVSKKKSFRRNFSLVEANRLAGGKAVVTVYVDNLSDDMDMEWLGQIFSKFGFVIDAFMPAKKSKRFLSKFGFIRFGSKLEAVEAIRSLNGIVIRDKKMVVKLASFDMVFGSSDFGRSAYAHKHSQGNRITKGKDVVVGSSKQFHNKLHSGKSFKEAVVGVNLEEGELGDKCGKPKHIVIKPNPTEWLQRSAVARLKSFSAMEAVREALHCEGVPTIEVKDMGGLWVVLTFPLCEEMQSFFNGGKLSWLHTWFDEANRWSPDRKGTRKRRALVDLLWGPFARVDCGNFQDYFSSLG
ncbi:hypothetical protein Vadar_022911 [Vaccinium darrowii]|uniref:Uncharacterized protein n=1 Tax=Vaccinium darrowii TaxID=229202 RepID=A0ACB7X3E4_9ERIC|nr:hypothetical protein Vadar_022911 [Vaccinium darrowii]